MFNCQSNTLHFLVRLNGEYKLISLVCIFSAIFAFSTIGLGLISLQSTASAASLTPQLQSADGVNTSANSGSAIEETQQPEASNVWQSRRRSVTTSVPRAGRERATTRSPAGKPVTSARRPNGKNNKKKGNKKPTEQNGEEKLLLVLLSVYTFNDFSADEFEKVLVKQRQLPVALLCSVINIWITVIQWQWQFPQKKM
jgi:hypothetical protein